MWARIPQRSSEEPQRRPPHRAYGPWILDAGCRNEPHVYLSSPSSDDCVCETDRMRATSYSLRERHECATLCNMNHAVSGPGNREPDCQLHSLSHFPEGKKRAAAHLITSSFISRRGRESARRCAGPRCTPEQAGHADGGRQLTEAPYRILKDDMGKASPDPIRFPRTGGLLTC